jgi:hypothetical protein
MIFSVTAITAFISAFFTLCLAIVLYLGSKETSPRAFGVFTAIGSFWVATRGFLYAIPPENIALATNMNKLSFFVGTLVAASFVYFGLSYPSNTKPSQSKLLLMGLSVLILLPIYFFDDLFLGKAIYVGGSGGLQRFAWEQGPYLPFYDLVFFGMWMWGITAIFINAHKEDLDEEKRRLSMFMFWSTLVGLVPLSFASLILPRLFNYFALDWSSPFAVSIWVGLVSYSVVKFKDMKVRYELSELYILACSILLFINIFLPY